MGTWSPENLISSALCKGLDAEFMEGADNLAGIKDTELEVEGAAMTWLGELGVREEIIYCLVVRDLLFDLREKRTFSRSFESLRMDL